MSLAFLDEWGNLLIKQQNRTDLIAKQFVKNNTVLKTQA